MIRERAPAKLNLFLHIAGRRADGYHDLESLVVFTEFGDELEFEREESPGLKIGLHGPGAPDLSALIEPRDPSRRLSTFEAAHLLADKAPVHHLGATIVLDKRVPVAAGLGGGSADAAATLRVLNKLWEMNLPLEELETLGVKLGADVPVCLRARPTFVSGIGEGLSDAPPLPPLALVIAHTKIALPTPDVFRQLRQAEWSGQCPRTLPPPPFGPRRVPSSPRLPGSRSDGWGEGAWPDVHALVEYLRAMRNDLEAPARRVQPAIGDLLGDLGATPGCLIARMSGSGAACFGIFETDAGATDAVRALEATGWWAVATKLFSPSPAGRRLVRPRDAEIDNSV
jgi:4-diphosphocytidyl-2-C-methyl-D-erythritol kinase